MRKYRLSVLILRHNRHWAIIQGKLTLQLSILQVTLLCLTINNDVTDQNECTLDSHCDGVQVPL